MMTRQEFYSFLDEALEMEPGTFHDGLELRTAWDSMGPVIFMAVVEDRFGMAVSSQSVVDCRSGRDRAELLQDRLVA
jgi:hypothetical protein